MPEYTPETLLHALKVRQLKVATAESCTGGLVAATLTDVPGSSAVFERGWVTYSNEAKADELGVPAALIAEHGAVSAEVARAMASGALEHSRADIAVAVTGIAGPDGGSAEKPVGLVFIATARKGGAIEVERFQFGGGTRAGIRRLSTEAALRAVAERLQDDNY